MASDRDCGASFHLQEEAREDTIYFGAAVDKLIYYSPLIFGKSLDPFEKVSLHSRVDLMIDRV